MALPIYPVYQGLTYDVKWSPVFFVNTQKTQSGASVDVALASTPLHQFELVYNFLRDSGPLGNALFTGSEFKGMMGFFLSLQGSGGRFLFDNPDDDNVTSQVIASSAQSDGVTDAWPLIRTFGDNTVGTGTEQIGQIHTPGPTTNVYYNGVLKTLSVDYVFDTTIPGQNMLSLINIPPAGQPITMDYSYRYYCKFQDPTLTFNKFLSQVWALQSVKIESCRPGT